MKEKLFGITAGELTRLVADMDMPRFAAGQIFAWLYAKGVGAIDGMTDISIAHRAALAERFVVGRSAPVRQSVSVDGTRKYLFGLSRSESPQTAAGISAPPTPPGGELTSCIATRDGGEFAVEAVYIPDRDRGTLCLSSQAGCRMGCEFCATGKMGLAANLSTGDILNQFASLPEFGRLTNIVYMGMGEPLDNLRPVLESLEILTSPRGYGWSPGRITLSTAGVAPALERFLQESRVNLAISLHNPFHDERAALMPIEHAYPIEEIVEIVRRHFLRGGSGGSQGQGNSQRRVSFEYILLEGINDSPRHIAGLTKLLNGLPCRVNLIRFHRIPGSPFFSPADGAVERFRNALTAKGLHTTIRASRGQDIEAACGLLSTKAKN